MAKWKVGITGGIGSGKTYCARIFAQLGIPVYFADERAQLLMRSDPEVKSQLIGLLGEGVYDDLGQLQKEFLRQQVFENPVKREAINGIVHPVVGRDYEKWHQEQQAPYSLKEAALLVEAGSYRSLDYLIMVRTPLVTRIQRTMARDGIDSRTMETRLASQWTDTEKERVSHLFIDNSGCFAVLSQILEIHKKLIT